MLPYLMKLCQPSHENSWLSPMHTNGKYARCVLDVGIVDMRAIDMAIAGEVSRHVEIGRLTAVRNAAKVVDGVRIAVRHLVGIFDDFVDEVAQMEHETQLDRPARARPPRSSDERHSARLR